jgi:hypothetical protein
MLACGIAVRWPDRWEAFTAALNEYGRAPLFGDIHAEPAANDGKAPGVPSSVSSPYVEARSFRPTETTTRARACPGRSHPVYCPGFHRLVGMDRKRCGPNIRIPKCSSVISSSARLILLTNPSLFASNLVHVILYLPNDLRHARSETNIIPH